MAPRLTNTTSNLPILNQALQDIESLKQRVTDLEQTTNIITYTPTVTAQTGAYTTVGASGRYQRLGKFIFLFIRATFPNVGTGGFPLISLPSAANGQTYSIGGTEIVANGKTVMAEVAFGGNGILVIRNYDGSSPAVNGAVICLSGFYEAAF